MGKGGKKPKTRDKPEKRGNKQNTYFKFKDDCCYHVLNVNLQFTLDIDLNCAIAEVVKVQVRESSGADIKKRMNLMSLQNQCL